MKSINLNHSYMNTTRCNVSIRSLIASIFMALTLTLIGCGSSGSSSNANNGGGYENGGGGNGGDNGNGGGNGGNEDDDYNADLPINELVDTSNLTSAYFGSLYSGRIPIDATKDKYDEKLFAMIGGKVYNEEGNSLKDVNVTIYGASEYGSTRTNSKGFYTIPAEGDKNLTIRFSKEGYLTIERGVSVKPQDWTLTPDVTLIEQDDKATLIDLKGDKPQTHVSSVVTDERGSRTASVVFKGSNGVTITDKEGDERTLETISVRATEFKTPSSMPANLPTETAFTYCVDITIDGVKDDENATFEKPLTLVVDNFLDFPVGAIVPVGYYDKNLNEWIASDNGIIVRLLDYYDENGSMGSDGVIDSLDSDGDGKPNDLNGDGSFLDEVAGLIEQSGSNSNANYQIGKTYQYVQITHFTAYDLNYPLFNSGARSPNDDEISTFDDKTACETQSCVSSGSYVTVKTQEHHDDIAITGVDSDIRLHYSSKSTQGYLYDIQTTIDTTTAPSIAIKANAVLEIAGNRFEREVELGKINAVIFTWDGKDALGNKLSGEIKGKLSVGYFYNLAYASATEGYAQAWAKNGGASLGVFARDAASLVNEKTVSVFVENAESSNNKIANGWTIEDGLFLNLNINGILSSFDSRRYIETKGDSLFAVSNEPQNRFTSAKIFTPSNRYYALFVDSSYPGMCYNEYELSLIDFEWINRAVTNVNQYPLGCITNYGFRTDYTSSTRPVWGFDTYASYRGTDLDGLYYVYFDASKSPFELKQKMLERENNGSEYMMAANYSGSLNSNNNFWMILTPSKKLRDAVDSVYLVEIPPLALDPVKFEFLNLGENDIIVNNGSLGYVYDLNETLLKTIFDNPTKRVIRTYAYDEKGKLISIKDRFENEIKIVRNADGIPSQMIASNGQTTKLLLSANGDLTSVVYENGETYRFEYDDKSLLTKKLTPNNNIYQYFYDDKGRTIRELDANNGEWRFEKVADGKNLAYKTTMPEGEQTIYSDQITANGDLISTITLPNGENYTFQTNASGEETSVVKDGVVTKTNTGRDPLTLDTIMKSQTIAMPSGRTKSIVRTIEYDGNISELLLKTTSIIVNNNATTVIENYQDARITIASPSTYIKQTIDYDKATGLTKSYQYAAFTPIAYEYDNKGRLIKQKQGDIDLISFAYDTRGSISSITDSNAQTTTFTYDKLDRITSVTYPNGARESYEYDSEGNVVKFRTPKETNVQKDKTFDFTYNPTNQRTSLTSPQSKTTRYSYNKNRQPLSIEYSSGKKALYNYDQGQLKSIQAAKADGTDEASYNYDYSFYNKVSSVTRVDKTNQSSNPLLPANETINYAYDGNLITSIAYQGAINETIGFTYNNDFNPTSITYGGKTDSYTYNNDSLLTKAGDWTISRTNQTGFVTQIYKSGFSKSYSYDPNKGYLSQISDSSYNQYITERYPNGKIKTLREGANTFNYQYDSLGRLTKVTKGDQNNQNQEIVEQYQYDNQGNRTKAIVYGVTSNASYNNDDELISYGSDSYKYDQDGFLKSKTTIDQVTNQSKTTSYTYGTLGELREVKLPDQTIIKYYQNANNQRVAKEVNGTIVEKYLWLNQTTLLGFYDKEGNFGRFTYATDRTPISLEYKGQSYYLSYNHLGSLKAVRSSSGVIKQIDYDSFGNVLSETNPSDSSGSNPSTASIDIPLGFAGGLYDRDTSLVRFGYRDYDPYVGRWTAKDPIDFNGGDSNLYAYVGNDPVNGIDPSGLEWQFSLGASGNLGGGMLPFPNGFVGGGASIGITSSGRFFISVTANTQVGAGWYGGVGGEAGISHTSCPTKAGISTQVQAIGSANAGWGASGGGSIQGSSLSDIGASKSLRVGIGFGMQASAGVSTTTTITSPTIGEIWSWVKSLFGNDE